MNEVMILIYRYIERIVLVGIMCIIESNSEANAIANTLMVSSYVPTAIKEPVTGTSYLFPSHWECGTPRPAYP
jgi:hypothetical protein